MNNTVKSKVKHTLDKNNILYDSIQLHSIEEDIEKLIESKKITQGNFVFPKIIVNKKRKEFFVIFVDKFFDFDSAVDEIIELYYPALSIDKNEFTLDAEYEYKANLFGFSHLLHDYTLGGCIGEESDMTSEPLYCSKCNQSCDGIEIKEWFGEGSNSHQEIVDILSDCCRRQAYEARKFYLEKGIWDYK
jgi:hypothetical protein